MSSSPMPMPMSTNSGGCQLSGSRCVLSEQVIKLSYLMLATRILNYGHVRSAEEKTNIEA